jgi:hypothetical protein
MFHDKFHAILGTDVSLALRPYPPYRCLCKTGFLNNSKERCSRSRRVCGRVPAWYAYHPRWRHQQGPAGVHS